MRCRILIEMLPCLSPRRYEGATATTDKRSELTGNCSRWTLPSLTERQIRPGNG